MPEIHGASREAVVRTVPLKFVVREQKGPISLSSLTISHRLIALIAIGGADDFQP